MGYGKLAPTVERKEDTTQNGSKIHEKMVIQRAKEQLLYPLRINEKTTILVTKDKCNEKYRKEYLKKINTKPIDIQF
jgi:hypothetical protein